MSVQVDGVGVEITLSASESFPAGLSLTYFSDDGDSIDIPTVEVASSAMGLNGDLLVWNKSSPLNINLSIIPNTPDDRNLSILTEANRYVRGKRMVRDTISLTISYADGRTLQFGGGRIMSGSIGNGVTSAQRLRTSTYNFTFESLLRS